MLIALFDFIDYGKMNHKNFNRVDLKNKNVTPSLNVCLGL